MVASQPLVCWRVQYAQWSSANTNIVGPTIIAAFGFSSEETTLLSMAPGAATVVGTFLALFIAKHTNRTFGGIFPVVLGCVGVLMMLKIPSANYAARYGGYVLTLQCKRSLFFSHCKLTNCLI